MAYHEDLIEHATFLSQYNLPNDPKQVDLRRAVSAAYYALFHLLTTEAAQNWKHQSQRNRFARMFDHGRMKTCSSKVSSRPRASLPVNLLNQLDQSFRERDVKGQFEARDRFLQEAENIIRSPAVKKIT